MNPYKIYHVLGLMSGSSLDGLDIAHCVLNVTTDGKFAVSNWEIEKAETLEFNEEWKDRLEELPSASGLELAKADAQFGLYIGQLVNEFLEDYPEMFDFIASHGHTIFHYPKDGFTTQIGSGAAIAATTNLTTICDFRSVDIALSGQGAPVVGIADKHLFKEYELLLNLGGICNLTKQFGPDHFSGDITVCNQVLNALAKSMGHEYDKDGDIAKSGHLKKTFLTTINANPFFEQVFPKSLDNQWVHDNLTKPFVNAVFEPEDLLTTAVEHIAFQISKVVEQAIGEPGFKLPKMMITGGGAFNDFLIERITFHTRDLCEIVIPDEKIIKYKEALLMALMGVMRMENQPNCFPTFTGASRPNIGGAIYLGNTNNPL